MVVIDTMAHYVYKFLNKRNNVLYVGKTDNIYSRIYQHFVKGHLLPECYEQVESIEYCKLNNKTEMSIYEIYYINKYQPKFNVCFNYGDKTQLELKELEWISYNKKIKKNKIAKKSNELNDAFDKEGENLIFYEKNLEYDKEKYVLFAEKTTRYIKTNNRKGAKVMKPNYVLLYAVLKRHGEGLTKAKIRETLTCNENQCMSYGTLTHTLIDMEDDGFITSSSWPKKYHLTELPQQEKDHSKIFTVNWDIIKKCIECTISREELSLYIFMRHLHNQEQRKKNPQTLKDNLFQISQIDIARDMGLSQGRISQMIINLIKENIIKCKKSESINGGFNHNLYKFAS